MYDCFVMHHLLHRYPALSAVLTGGALVAAQLFFVCVVQGRGVTLNAWARLFQWDSVHYGHLVERGYFNTLPPLIGETDPGRASFQKHTNVAFFPGYIIVGRVLRTVTGLTVRGSLLLVSLIAAFGFWVMLLLFLRMLQIPRRVQWLAIASILAYPAAFFLVAAYSESLFLLGLLGFLYWCERRTPLGAFLAAVHGIIMTATRIFGIPLAVYPMIVASAHPGSLMERVRRVIVPTMITLGASLGAVGFFAYSSVFLGKWNLYMLVQQKMWGLTPDPLIIFHPPLALFVPLITGPLLYGNVLSIISVSLTFWLLVFAAVVEVFRRRREDTQRPQRIGLLVTAAGVLYLSVASLASMDFHSFIRYAYVPYMLIVFALASHMRTVRMTRTQMMIASCIIGAVLMLFSAVQISFVRAFAEGLWVA